MKSRSRRGWNDDGDEFVPIRTSRLAAAVRYRGITVSELADRAGGEKQQTVDLIVRGVTKNCRRARLERLAKVLRVPARWLSGEIQHLPGAWYHADIEATREAIRAGGRAVYVEDPDEPSFLQLVESDFTPMVRKALEREWSERTDDLVAEHELAQWTYNPIQQFLLSLIDPQRWREILFEPPPIESASGGREQSVQDDEAAAALAKAFRHVLDPWLTGRARLNLERILPFAEPTTWEEEIAPRRKGKRRRRK